MLPEVCSSSEVYGETETSLFGAAIPVALIIGRVFTRFVEEPITAYGRSWKWSDERRVLKSQMA